MGQGRGEAPRAKPLERGGARKANRAFRLASPAERERPERQTERSAWLRRRNAKEKPLPVQETKPFPHVRPAPPKEESFDRGTGGIRPSGFTTESAESTEKRGRPGTRIVTASARGAGAPAREPPRPIPQI